MGDKIWKENGGDSTDESSIGINDINDKNGFKMHIKARSINIDSYNTDDLIYKLLESVKKHVLVMKMLFYGLQEHL